RRVEDLRNLPPVFRLHRDGFLWIAFLLVLKSFWALVLICLAPFVAREQVSLQISRHKTGGPMTQTRRMTMKLASTTERASLIWRKKGLIFASCVILASGVVAIALATPNSGVLSNVLSRATFARFHVESQIASQNGHFEVELHTTGV